MALMLSSELAVSYVLAFRAQFMAILHRAGSATKSVFGICPSGFPKPSFT